MDALLPPDHFLRTSQSLTNDEGDNQHVPVQGQGHHIGNYNVPAGNFNQVVNFGRGGMAPQFLRGEDGAFGTGGSIGFVPHDQQSGGDSEDLEEQYLDDGDADPPNNIIERFKQLRELQQLQQEKLIQQQQAQLEMLREEQEKMQKMMVKQREHQWGGSAAGPTQNLNGPVTSKPPMGPRPQGSAQTMAQASLALAKQQQSKQESTPTKKGLPVPQLPSEPETPVDYLVNGNPALDSDSASYAGTRDSVDSAICRLPDSASEVSALQFPAKQALLPQPRPKTKSPKKKRKSGEPDFSEFLTKVSQDYYSSESDSNAGEPDFSNPQKTLFQAKHRLHKGPSGDMMSINQGVSHDGRSSNQNMPNPNIHNVVEPPLISQSKMNGPHKPNDIPMQTFPREAAPPQSHMTAQFPLLSMAGGDWTQLQQMLQHQAQFPTEYIIGDFTESPEDEIHPILQQQLQQQQTISPQGSSGSKIPFVTYDQSAGNLFSDSENEMPNQSDNKRLLYSDEGDSGNDDLSEDGNNLPDMHYHSPTNKHRNAQFEIHKNVENQHRMDPDSQRMAQNSHRMNPNSLRMDPNSQRMDQHLQRIDQNSQRMDLNSQSMDQHSQRIDQNYRRMDPHSHGDYQSNGDYQRHAAAHDNHYANSYSDHDLYNGDNMYDKFQSAKTRDQSAKYRDTQTAARVVQNEANGHDLRQYEEDRDDDHSEEELGDENEGESGADEAQPNEDDRIITGIGTKRKTFEQLLEEELKKEEAKVKEEERQAALAENYTSSKPKPFLRKGQGTSRFQSAPKKPKPRPAQTRKPPVPKQTQQNSHPAQKQTHPAPKQAPPSGHSVSKKGLKTGQVGHTAKGGAQNKEIIDRKRVLNKLVNKTKPASVKQNVHPRAAASTKRSPPKQTEPHSVPSKQQVEKNSPEVDLAKSTDFSNDEVENKTGVEQAELEEFELLEQYADDNASFLSNVSAVNRVLKEKKEQTKAIKEVDESSSEDNDETHAPSDSDLDSDDSHDENTLDKTLTDTHESPEKRLEQHNTQETVSHKQRSDKIQSLKLIHRKIRSLNSPGDVAENKDLLNHVEFDSDSESRGVSSNANYGADMLNKNKTDNRFAASSNRTPSVTDTGLLNGGVQISSNLPNGATHISSARHPNNVLDDLRTNEVHNDISHSETNRRNVQVSKTEEVALGHKSSSESEDSDEETEEEEDFEDDEAWDDSVNEETPKKCPDVVNNNADERPKSKQAFSQVKVVKEEEDDSLPPTSKLVSKLFPRLKPEKPAPQLQMEQEKKLHVAQEPTVSDGIQSKQLRDKLMQLETEIEKFRRENSTLEKLRKDREKSLEELKHEMSEFEKQKNGELKRIQEYKNEEIKKLKKDRKVFEQYTKAAKAVPDKKEREEIQSLKQQVSDLQEEMKRKEQRWTASTTRLRDRVEQLDQENTELKEEIKILEKRRLEMMAQQQQQQLKVAASVPVPSALSEPKPSVPHLMTSQGRPQMATAKSLPRQHTPEGAENVPRHSTAQFSSVELSEDGSSIGPEDSASKTATGPQPTAYLHSSPHKQTHGSPKKEGGQKKSIPRKKAVAMSISQAIDKGDEQYEELQHPDGKVERIYTNGAREILFSNGTRKQVSADGQAVIVSFFNGDIKQLLPDQRVVYYYADAGTTHTTYPDGLEILQFQNNQQEKHYPDGTKEITFADQTIKYLFPSGVEESIFPDGTVIRVEKNGDKTMEFPNGQREIHTPQYKKREYPDGTVKTVYPDGRQETRYSSGRIRVKDREGAVILDKRVQ